MAYQGVSMAIIWNALFTFLFCWWGSPYHSISLSLSLSLTIFVETEGMENCTMLFKSSTDRTVSFLTSFGFLVDDLLGYYIGDEGFPDVPNLKNLMADWPGFLRPFPIRLPLPALSGMVLVEGLQHQLRWPMSYVTFADIPRCHLSHQSVVCWYDFYSSCRSHCEGVTEINNWYVPSCKLLIY